MGKAQLEPERDGAGPLASLAAKLYRHAHNKIAGLDEQEVGILMARWDAPGGSRGSKYDPLAEWLRQQKTQEIVVSFKELEALVGSLPTSAQRPQFWANTKGAHTNVQREAWRAAGYDAFLLQGQAKVRFVRVGPNRGQI